jgi:hypothetical protein
MKKYVHTILLTILVMSFITGCKKSNSSAPKDYTAAIKDKTWWGELAYTGKTPEYYSVHFNADNTLTWSQFQGDYTGHWALNNKQVTITFDGNSIQIKADIADDDKLINITDNTPASEINSAALVANPNIPLDNTVWDGTTLHASGTAIPPTTAPFHLNFLPGFKVEITIGIYSLTSYSYRRSSSGEVIRIDGQRYFGVLLSSGEMKGSAGNSTYPWQATKK